MKKKLVRKHCFETNSSSSHSISLAGEDKQFVLDTIYPNQKGQIFLNGGEFGWEWFKHNDSETKANYAAVDFDGDETLTEMLVEVIKEQTGATEVIFNFGKEYSSSNWSYIDHDSTGLVPRTKETLKDFIFNKNSWLFGGNDNSTPDPTFYHVPEIRDNMVITPEYKFELVIEGFDKTTKFLKKPTTEEISNGIESLLSHRYFHKTGQVADEDFTSNIMFQINASKRDLYELSWSVEQNYKKNRIILNKVDCFYPFENKLKEEGKLENLNWEEKRKFITKELLKDKELSMVIKFTLKEL